MLKENSFVDRKLTDVLTEMNGVVLQEIVVPNRKMNVVLVGVVNSEGTGVMLSVFGTRKADGTVSTRFDVAHNFSIKMTSLYKGEDAQPESAVKFERNHIRKSVYGRVARNFFRRVVRTPEFQESGMEYYQTLKEPNFYLALCIELDTLNQLDPANRVHEVVFPELTSTVRFNLGKEAHNARRFLRYSEKSKLVSAEYRFYTGSHWGANTIRGLIHTPKLEAGELAGGLTLATTYSGGAWERAQEFVDRHADVIRAFYATMKASGQ